MFNVCCGKFYGFEMVKMLELLMDYFGNDVGPVTGVANIALFHCDSNL